MEIPTSSDLTIFYDIPVNGLKNCTVCFPHSVLKETINKVSASGVNLIEGNCGNFVIGRVGNFKINGDDITCDVVIYSKVFPEYVDAKSVSLMFDINEYETEEPEQIKTILNAEIRSAFLKEYTYGYGVDNKCATPAKKTRIISAFPGCGKTYYYEYMAPLNESVLDSDSSKFSWLEDGTTRNAEFPYNYIKHIEENMGKVDVILVSSHAIVREALEDECIEFTLVYPSRDLKADYLARYAERGSPKAFLDMIDANWDDFITQLENQKQCKHIVLLKDEFLLDRV